jgi:ribonuclease P protein component
MPRSHFSFPKNRRLTRAAEFERVKSEGFLQHGKILMLAVLHVEYTGPFRAGFVTSRRLGSAVVRNRVRRRLRELVRRHQQEVRASFWIVVIAKSEAARASYHALEDEWLRLAKRASILAARCS